MNKKNIVWIIVNDEHQPLFTDGRYWIFSTKEQAEEFLAKGKHLRPRTIIKTIWSNKRGKKLKLVEK